MIRKNIIQLALMVALGITSTVLFSGYQWHESYRATERERLERFSLINSSISLVVSQIDWAQKRLATKIN